MNLNEMQSAWNSPRNNLPTEEQQRLAGQFTRQMRRRRRFQAIWLINTFVWLTLITGLVIRTVAAGPAALAQEWALLPLLILPWALALHFLRRQLQPVAPGARGELPVADSLRAALGSNQTERTRLQQVGGLFVLMIPLLAVAIQQLHAAGKVSARELVPLSVFFGGALLVSGAVMAARYFGRLSPQRRQLEALLGELAEESPVNA